LPYPKPYFTSRPVSCSNPPGAVFAFGQCGSHLLPHRLLGTFRGSEEVVLGMGGFSIMDITHHFRKAAFQNQGKTPG